MMTLDDQGAHLTATVISASVAIAEGVRRQGAMARSATDGDTGETRPPDLSPHSKDDLGGDAEPSTSTALTAIGGTSAHEANGGSFLGEEASESIEIGTIHLENCTYEGELKDGRPHGRGVYRFANGNDYDGEVKEEEMHGKGTYRWKDTNVYDYEGQWVGGKENGKGTLRWRNGRIYEGGFVNGEMHGRGTITCPSGAVYEGEFKDGKKHGRGTLTYALGDVYDGQWVEGKQHGKGTATYASGNVYEGQWVEGTRHGKGNMTNSSGRVYEGNWINGLRVCNNEHRRKLRSQRSQQRRNQTATKTCEHCGVDDYQYKLRMCSGCGLVLYCSDACQKAARGSHQRICNIVADLPPRNDDKLALRFNKEKRKNDFDAGLRYGTKYMDKLKHLEIDVTEMVNLDTIKLSVKQPSFLERGYPHCSRRRRALWRMIGRDDSVKLSEKRLSSLLRRKKGELDSFFWKSRRFGFLSTDTVWTELHGLKQLRLEHPKFDAIHAIQDIIYQQKNTLMVLCLPDLGIDWSRAKCRKAVAQTISSCKNLVKLNLDGSLMMDSDLKLMLQDLPDLRVLDLRRNFARDSHEFTDNTCGLIARKCPGLQELSLANHNHLSVRGIRKILEGCVHLRMFFTTTCKLSCGDVRNLLDIAPQLLYLSLGKEVTGLDEIIEATGGRTLIQFLDTSGIWFPDSLSAKTQERYDCQRAVFEKILSQREDHKVVNEWCE